MSDYISRLEAINAMESINDGICEQQAIDALCELPSAQPEIIRCKDCKYRVDYSDGDGWYCDVTNNCLMRDENFYCSYGERKHDE